MTSGLSRPPDRSFCMSSFNLVRASETPVCSCVKSKGSAPSPPPVVAAGADSASSLRLFLSFFLLREADVVKVCRCRWVSVFGMRGVVEDGVWCWEEVCLMAMLYWGLFSVEIGRIRHFDVFVAVEMYLLVARDIF